jgi:peptide/nickel transport system substrate-binding protein
MHWQAEAGTLCAGIVLLSATVLAAGSKPPTEEVAKYQDLHGSEGGSLVVYQRAEPKTLNPLFGFDLSSREVIGLLQADLVHINRKTHEAEPALASGWKVSEGGRVYTLRLRRGLHFSDGEPFTADDVVFSFQLYLDEKLNAPQRDLLVVGGKPLRVEAVDAWTVRMELSRPYAAAERLFDSLAIVPRHAVEKAYREGTADRLWPLDARPESVVGMGPYRLKAYKPGESLVLERNPFYWKVDGTGRRLPYLDTIEFRFAGSEDAQLLRFVNGDAGMLSGLGARNFEFLKQERRTRGAQLVDAGPGLEYNFLFFNLRPGAEGGDPAFRVRQGWFAQDAFRQAVSAAIDREGIVRLVYGGRAAAIWGPVTPGDRRWWDAGIPRPARSIERARALLGSAGFHWNAAHELLDSRGNLVEFSIVTSSSNAERRQTATVIQNDLSQLGMKVEVVPLEFRAMLDRVMRAHRFDAAMFGLASGDADPNADMNIWLSSGGMHLWNPEQTSPATGWEAEIDELMERQMSEMDGQRRKTLFDRVQALIAEHLPVICTVSPDILAAAKAGLGNFSPAVVAPYTLWNVEQLYWMPASGRAGEPGAR